MIFKIFATIVATNHADHAGYADSATGGFRETGPAHLYQRHQRTGDIDPDSAPATTDGAVGSAERFTPGNRCGNAETYHSPVGFHQPADLPGQ